MESNSVNKIVHFDDDVLNKNKEHEKVKAFKDSSKVETLSGDNTNVIRTETIPSDNETKDKERLSKIEEKDSHWSWYGYSRGFVHDGYIRSDNTLVVKERYVGDNSFLFNHKDYTDAAAHDYYKNMNVKRMDDEHELKVNHTKSDLIHQPKQMKSPDVFVTNVCISPSDITNAYEDDVFEALVESSRDDSNANVNSTESFRDDSNTNVNSSEQNTLEAVIEEDVQTEYIDEVNVTILREDISIEEHVLADVSKANNEDKHSSSCQCQQVKKDDIMNSYEDIPHEDVKTPSPGVKKRIKQEPDKQGGVGVSDLTKHPGGEKDSCVFDNVKLIHHREEKGVGDGCPVEDYVIIDLQGDSGMSWHDQTGSGVFIEVK